MQKLRTVTLASVLVAMRTGIGFQSPARGTGLAGFPFLHQAKRGAGFWLVA